MITNVIQRNKTIYIYNERGVEQATIMVSSLPNSGLKGFTSQSVSVQQGAYIQTYDEKGYMFGDSIQTGSDFSYLDDNSNNHSSSGGSNTFRLICIVAFIGWMLFIIL